MPKIQLSQKHFWKKFKIIYMNIGFESWKLLSFSQT